MRLALLAAAAALVLVTAALPGAPAVPALDAAGVAVEAQHGTARLVAPDGGDLVPALDAPPSLQAGRVVFVDRAHQNAVSQQVALTGDGSAGWASWWLNNDRVAKYDPAVGRTWAHSVPAVGLSHHVGASATGDVAAAVGRAIPFVPPFIPQPPVALTWLDAAALLEPQPTLLRPLAPCCAAASDVSATGRVATAAHLSNGQSIPDPGVVTVQELGAAPVWEAVFTDQLAPGLTPRVLQGLDLSADGTALAVTTYNNVFVYRFPASTPTVIVPNRSQTVAKLSSDGTWLAVGGFASQAHLYKWDGAAYTKQWSANVGHPWVTAVAVADDGTLLAGTFEYRGGNAGKVAAYNADGTLRWQCVCYGDYVDDLAITPDGARAAAVSWGTYAGPGGDVLTAFDVASGAVLFRVLDDAAEVGSLHGVAISDDGRTVLAGGKAVHARTFGNGGMVYGIALD